MARYDFDDPDKQIAKLIANFLKDLDMPRYKATMPSSPKYSIAVKAVKQILDGTTRPFTADLIRASVNIIIGGYSDPDVIQYRDEIIEEFDAIINWMARKQIVARYEFENKEEIYFGNRGLIVGKTIDDGATPDVVKDEEEDDTPVVVDRVKYDDKPKVKKDLEPAITELQDRVDTLSQSVNLWKVKYNTLEKQIAELEKTRKVEFTIIENGKKEVVKGTVHEAFPEVLFQVKCGYNVLLVGPSGCGKTELALSLHKHLKTRFGMISLSGGVMENKLFGRSTPNINTGKQEFHAAQFAEFFEKGGLFLLDELDGADPNVLLSLNGPLSNGVMPLDRAKNPIVNVHEKFICIGAANTYGAGADRHYVGRNQLDTAFLKRFVYVTMDYDKNLEFKLCPGKTDFVERMHRYRAAMYNNRIERLLDTRFILRGYNWLKHGKDDEYVDNKLFEGWRPDEIQKVKK